MILRKNDVHWNSRPDSCRIILHPGRKYLRVWKKKVYHEKWDCPLLAAEMPFEPHQIHEDVIKAGGYRACQCVENPVLHERLLA